MIIAICILPPILLFLAGANYGKRRIIYGTLGATAYIIMVFQPTAVNAPQKAMPEEKPPTPSHIELDRFNINENRTRSLF